LTKITCKNFRSAMQTSDVRFRIIIIIKLQIDSFVKVYTSAIIKDPSLSL